MHSRAILFLSMFAFTALVVIGSVALHLSSASASTSSGGAPAAAASPIEPTDGSASGAPQDSALFQNSSRSDLPDTRGGSRALSARERSVADSLSTLMRQVHAMFEPEAAGVSYAMIPYLAEVITVINQYDHLVYRIDIVEPDAALALRRAQTLNDVLRLNVLEPSKLRIVGRQGLHAAPVEVAAP